MLYVTHDTLHWQVRKEAVTVARGVAGFLLRRVLGSAMTLLVSSFVVFGALYAAPGSPTDFLLGNRPASPELVAQVRADYHLDEPFLVRYGIWLRDLVHGDLGTSALHRQSVSDLLADRLPITIQLVLMTLALVVLIGVSLGALASQLGGLVDDLIVAATSVLNATPAFVTAVVLIAVFAVNLGWFPVFGPGDHGTDRFVHLLLPSVALATAWVAIMAQTSRAAIGSQLNSEYVETAHARGLPGSCIFVRHVMRNALGPIIAATGLALAGLLATSALVEVAFQLPGLGALLISSVGSRDFPVVQALCLLLVGVLLVVNLLVELMTHVLDPRHPISGARA